MNKSDESMLAKIEQLQADLDARPVPELIELLGRAWESEQSTDPKVRVMGQSVRQMACMAISRDRDDDKPGTASDDAKPETMAVYFRAYLSRLPSDDDRRDFLRSLGVCWDCGRVCESDGSGGFRVCHCTNDE